MYSVWNSRGWVVDESWKTSGFLTVVVFWIMRLGKTALVYHSFFKSFSPSITQFFGFFHSVSTVLYTLFTGFITKTTTYLLIKEVKY